MPIGDKSNNKVSFFSLGKNKKEEINKKIKNDAKLLYGFLDNNLIFLLDDILTYNNKRFKRFSSPYIKKEYRKDNIVLYRCSNYRKD